MPAENYHPKDGVKGVPKFEDRKARGSEPTHSKQDLRILIEWRRGYKKILQKQLSGEDRRGRWRKDE